MKISEIEILNEKAKTKKDGVYSYKGILWVVKNNRFIAYSERNGDCKQRLGYFDLSIGKVPVYDRRKELLKWLKQQKP